MRVGISVQLSPELVHWLAAYAEARKMSFDDAVEQMIEEGLKKGNFDIKNIPGH